MKTLIHSLLILLLVTPIAMAQDSSLMLVTPPAAKTLSPTTATLANSSFIYSTLPPEAQTRPLAIHDIITVLVDHRSTLLGEGSGQTRKIGNYKTTLTDWIKFNGKSINPAPQRLGDPAIGGTLNSQFRAESDIEARESLAFTIAAKIVDIRPNGDLVIEGRKEIKVNEEIWMTFLTGTVSRQFIGLDRTVRDSAISDLRINKYELGAVRDGYARGWLSRAYGKFKAF